MRKIWILATCGILALCLVAVFLFSAEDAMPTITPKIPTATPMPTPNVGQTYFPEPLVYEDLDIFPNMTTDTYQNATCIVYRNGEICYISETCYKYEKSQDGQKATALTSSGKLWFIDAHGTHLLGSDVSDFSLAGNGRYLYFISNNTLFGYDPQTTTCKSLFTGTTDITFLVSSPAGSYCAFSETDNEIYFLERRSSSTSTISLSTKITSVAAVSDDGQWIYGYCPDIGFVRVNAPSKSLTKLSSAGDIISKLYFNKDATELYYEYEQNLYFCNNESMPKKVLDMDGAWWQLLLENPNDVYTREYLYVGDMFFYNGTFSSRTLLYGMHNLYRAVPWKLDVENILWYNDVCAIFKDETRFLLCCINRDIPTHIVLFPEVTDHWKDVLDYASDILLYLDTENMMHVYKVKTSKDLFAINFSDIDNYALSQDRNFYYLTHDGVLNVFSIENQKQSVLGNFPSNADYSDVYLLEQSGGVYLYDNRESTRKVYQISMKEPYIIYLGEEA